MTSFSLDIEKLIPHRDRMKLIRSVVNINSDTVTTLCEVSVRWPLYRDGGVDPIVLIEVVAQTAGVHVSWKRGVEVGAGELGWLVGIKKADFFTDEIPLHATLITTAKNLYSVDNYSVFEGSVMNGEKLLCRIQIQVYRSNDT